MPLWYHLVRCPVDQRVTYVYHSGVRMPEEECKLAAWMRIILRMQHYGQPQEKQEDRMRILHVPLPHWREKPFIDLAL